MAPILTYYNNDAYFSFNDREFIIKRGVQEWLPAALARPHAVGIPAAMSRKSISAHSGRKKSDLVILIANVVGGSMDEWK